MGAEAIYAYFISKVYLNASSRNVGWEWPRIPKLKFAQVYFEKNCPILSFYVYT